MPTRRGWAAFGAGISLWIVARFIGSPDLHMVAAGIAAMPFLAAAFVHWSNVRLEVHRNLAMHGAGTGESSVRHLQHSAAEFYTMREYVTGDDLRRIHWPSVARTGQLMIRQDEATRRSNATLFLDNRSSSLGQDGSPGF